MSIVEDDPEPSPEPNPDPSPDPDPDIDDIQIPVANNIQIPVANNNINIPVLYKYNINSGCVVNDLLCVFTHAGDRTVFLDQQISQGIYQWTVRIMYKDRVHSEFSMGIASTSLVPKLEKQFIGILSGSCAFSFWRNEYRECYSTFTGTNSDDGSLIAASQTAVHHRSKVMAELNMDDHTLSFFVNERKVPHVITELPESVQIGMTGHFRNWSSSDLAFRTVSFCKVPASTQSAQVCKLHTLW